MPLYITFLILALITLLLHIADKRKEQADDRRTRKLVALAKQKYPRNALTESLGELYTELYEKIVEANIQGKSIERLRHDRELIAEETCRIWRQEIDRKHAGIEAGSSYHVTVTGTLTAEKLWLGTTKNSTPRQSASALTGTSD